MGLGIIFFYTECKEKIPKCKIKREQWFLNSSIFMNLKCFSWFNEVFAFENVNSREYKMLTTAFTGHI